MGFYKNDTTPADNTSINGIGVTGTSNPTNIDNALRELAAQGAQFARDIGGSVTVGGTADAISLTLNDTVANAYFDGMMVGFVAGSDNTSTAPTANVNSIGAKVIKKAPASTAAETALAAGDIQAGGLYLLRYRSAWASAAGAWQLIDLQHDIPVGDVDLSGNKLILDADDDSWLQSTADDSWLWKAGNQTIAEHGYSGSAYHFLYGATNLYTTKFPPSALTISSGAVTATRSHHMIDTEGAASTDDLLTINGVADGMFLFLRPSNDARTVVIKEGGNIYLQGGSDIVLDDYRDICCLWSDGTYWYEVFRPSGDSGSSSDWNYETPVAVTAVSSISFTGLTGASEIEIIFDNVKKASDFLVQIGDSGGIETTGYVSSSAAFYSSANTESGVTTGFNIKPPNTTLAVNGVMRLHKASSDGLKWASTHSVGQTTFAGAATGGGFKTLSAELTQLSVIGTFVAGGTIHVRWR